MYDIFNGKYVIVSLNNMCKYWGFTRKFTTVWERTEQTDQLELYILLNFVGKVRIQIDFNFKYLITCSKNLFHFPQLYQGYKNESFIGWNYMNVAGLKQNLEIKLKNYRQ